MTFLSAIGSGFGEPGVTPPPGIPSSTPPGNGLNIFFRFCIESGGGR